MNQNSHVNHVELEGTIVAKDEKVSPKGKTYIAMRIKSTQVRSNPKGDISTSYQTFIQAWGKLVDIAKGFNVDDEVRIEGSFSTDVKEWTVIDPKDKKPKVMKIYQVYINVKSLSPLIRGKETLTVNNFDTSGYEEMPF